MKRVSVKVQGDHLERLTRVRKPIIALVEVIWNSLDADATRVTVRFRDNNLGQLDEVTITDNGLGIHSDEVVAAFENLGGSWKRTTDKTKGGRFLHGRAGKGRFRAFFIGDNVKWDTRYRDDGKIYQYQVISSINELGTFGIGETVESEDTETGTEVVIYNIGKAFRSLRGEEAILDITEYFAPYLRLYPDVKIIYDHSTIDPSLIVARDVECQLPSLTLEDGRTVDASLTILEWKIRTDRSLYLCDKAGIALEKTAPGIHARGFDFTAYLKSDYLRELDDNNLLYFEEMHVDLRNLVDLAKNAMRDHFRLRAAEESINVVEEWKKQEIYPYEGEPTSIVEGVERQVFDVCALSIHEYLPDFVDANVPSKRLSFRLLRQALEESPDALQIILTDVLQLPRDKQLELANLLRKTTLAAIINASKIVANRLEFIKGLETILFEKEIKEVLLERSQLHRIIAENTWVFGEEYNLTIDDESLTQVLKKHLHLLGRDKMAGDLEPVRRDNGTHGIVDLMLSRSVPQPRADEHEHLVIELKRPNKKIDYEEVKQIESYAFAVAEDERFRDTATRWIFWVLSNEMSGPVRKKVRQKDRPEGILYDDPEDRITIWVKTWAQVIRDSSARLEFIRKHLEYAADQESALAYLRETHSKYLPKVVREQSTNQQPEACKPNGFQPSTLTSQN